MSAALGSTRSLATGVVYIRNLPPWCNEQRLQDAAHAHGHVYGVWISNHSRKALKTLGNHHSPHSSKRTAAIRITNTSVPESISEIAQLPEPTLEEKEQISESLASIVRYLNQQNISAEVVTKEPDMFQTRAAKALGMGVETRLFDKRTSDKPRFTEGMLDGYREGFKKGHSRLGIESLLRQAKESEDEMLLLTELFEHLHETSSSKQ
ncbi:hypothetical protein GGI15_000067 [Coemansia interrupta]|uniref:Uncharacterized protein n=1 Tax=Coemansia interrupta TaxID=1126814 RepID=A0A9W8HNW7_9FUNG|nr:hypothetical protein GGI15_000067 [Coemansia interrupta]